MSADMVAIAVEAVATAFTGTKSGAITITTIRKTASSRQRWIKRFTPIISHSPAEMESDGPSRNRQLP